MHFMVGVYIMNGIVHISAISCAGKAPGKAGPRSLDIEIFPVGFPRLCISLHNMRKENSHDYPSEKEALLDPFVAAHPFHCLALSSILQR